VVVIKYKYTNIMSINYLLSSLFGLIIMVMYGCSIGSHKETYVSSSGGKMDSYSITNVKSEDTIVVYPHIIGDITKSIDTTLNEHYRVSYTLHDNNEIIAVYPFVEGKGIDTIYYAGRACHLSIFDIKRNHILIDTEIDKSYFYNLLPQSELANYSICYLRLLYDDEMHDTIVFSTNLCVPDSDICYDFLLYISYDGTITVEWDE